MDVLIDGVRYVPAGEVSKAPDAVARAVRELTSMLYHQDHKPYAHAWDALHALAPDIATLASDDPAAACEAADALEVSRG